MSASVSIWKRIAREAATAAASDPPLSMPSPTLGSTASDATALALARQIFIPSAAVRRRKVLFAAADAETRVFETCNQLATALCELSGVLVAIVESRALSTTGWCDKNRARNQASPSSWRTYSSQIGERLWRVPVPIYCGDAEAWSQDEFVSPERREFPFDFVLFAASITDGETPMFSPMCEAAVLLLTANRTRREAALRPKQQLLSYGIPLLGSVLDERVFPIPEAIYRRL